MDSNIKSKMADTLPSRSQHFSPDSLSSAGSAPRAQPLKDLPDSGYASLVDTTIKAESTRHQDNTSLTSIPSIPNTNSSNTSFNAGLPIKPALRKTDSSASGHLSVMSIPVTGGLPLGSLRVVQPGAEKTATCLENGDVFLMLGGLPANFTVGCDGAAITTTGKVEFHGFRDLPPGPHFVWVSAPGAMTRSGYWFVTGGEKVVRVAQWDAYNEVLGEPASKFEAKEAKDGVDGVRDKLLPYGSVVGGRNGSSSKGPSISSLAGAARNADDEASALWNTLTSCITSPLLWRVTGRHDGPSEFLFDTTDTIKGEVAAGLFPFSTAQTTGPSSGLVKTAFSTELNFLFPPNEVDSSDDADTNTKTNTQFDNVVPIMRKLSVSSRTNPVISRSTSDDITATISTLLSFSATPIAEPDLIGEFQLAFLTALHLSSPSCAAHWWRLLLHVYLRAHDLISERPGLAAGVLAALRAQMVYAEGTVDVGAGEEEDGADGNTGSTGALEFLAALAESNSRGGFDIDIAGGRRSGRRAGHGEPGHLTKLRAALARYKRKLEAVLLDGGKMTAEQVEVGERFREVEAWFWRVGWDLREEGSGGLNSMGGGKEMGSAVEERNVLRKPRAEEEEDDDGEYAPVVVQLDERGREVGLVSWD